MSRGWSWSRPGAWSWPCDSSCTWSRPSGEFMAFDGYVPVSMLHKFQQFGQMTVAGIPLVQTVQKTVEIPLCSSLAGFSAPVAVRRQVLRFDSSVSWRGRYCSSSTVVDIPVVVVQTVHGELPKMHFSDSRRNSSCGANCAKTVDFPRVQFSAVF